MDKSNFSAKSPGRIVQIDGLQTKSAFIPAVLPPAWKFDPDLWPLLADAKESLGRLSGIGLTLPDPELLLRPLQSRESISSSSIEGTFVTPEQLLLFEIDPSEPESTHEPRADWREVSNYGSALRLGCEMIGRTSMSHYLIRSMHSILMQGVRGRDKSPGEYRSIQVQIGSDARFVPPPPGEVPELMENFVTDANESESSFDPLVKAYVAHYQFEAIHPFVDGNGRMGRVLLSLMISKWLGHPHPWLYLSPFFEEYRDEYVEKMYRISTQGKWGPWIEFCLRATIAQANDAIERCEKFRTLKEEFHARIENASPRTHQLIESLFRDPAMTIPSAAKKLGVSYPTAKSDIEKLVECGILTSVEQRHPKVFLATEIIKIAYR